MSDNERALAVRLALIHAAHTLLGTRYGFVRNFVLGVPLARSRVERLSRILGSGILDRTYYTALAGRTFRSSRDAARHWKGHGLHRRLPPHPLIDLEFLPAPVVAEAATGSPGTILDYLESPEAAHHSWGPLFDPRRLPDGTDPLAHLATITDDDEVAPGMTLAALRDLLIETTEQVRQQERIRHHVHVEDSWDAAAERRYLARAPQPRDRGADAVAVSVAIPVWNREQVVGAAIESVRAQTFDDWELLLVDDGSTDGSLATLEGWAALDPRIRVLARPHEGVGAARNAALDAARGEYIAFLDSDNTWKPTHLRTAVGALDADDTIGTVYSAIEMHDAAGTSYRGYQMGHEELLADNGIDLNCIVTRTALARDAGGFDRRLRRWIDHDLVLRLAARAPLRYLPYLGCRYDHHDDAFRITTTESRHWQFVVYDKNLVDWADAAAAPRVPGRVSVVTLAYEDHARTVAAVESLLAHEPGADVEVLVLDNGSRPTVARVLRARFARLKRVSYVRMPRNYNFATGCNVAASLSSGEYLYFLNNDTVTRTAWRDALVGALDDPGIRGVQPLLAFPDGTVQTAGTVFPDGGILPVHFLPRHPLDDARRHGGHGFQAVTGGALMVRAAEFIARGGFDPIFVNGIEDVDYCLRAIAAAGGEFRVRPEVLVVHEESRSHGRHAAEQENRRIFVERWPVLRPDAADHYDRLGLRIARLIPETQQWTGLARPWVVPDERLALAHPDRMRWAIKIGADFTAAGDQWGDVPFADDLAEALRELGQDAVVDRHPAAGRSTVYLDDVVLTLRGRHPIPPQRGRINAMWVISRPELVTDEELRAYDLVFAASHRWAAHTSARTGVPVIPLPQATNPRRFSHDPGIVRDGPPTFVGGPRPGIGRAIVTDAVATGAEVHVWGPNWARYAPGAVVRGDYLHPDRTAEVYRSSSVVLNDHLEGMSEWGFISNRIFDAVASGGRVVTDHVDGLERFFGATVRSYRDTDELHRLLTDPAALPGEDEVAALAARVAELHSFRRRAQVLLDLVLSRRPASPR